MPKINIEPRTMLWHEYRRERIMATDASVICGTNPYKTVDELIEDKLGFSLPIEETEIMRRGIDLEPHVRKWYNDQFSQNDPFVDCVFENNKLYWISASLDGMNSKGEIIEIKCPGKTNHYNARRGNIPAYYMTQMQHQMMVTGASHCTYISHRPEDKVPYVVHKIERDIEYINQMFEKEKTFWDYLCNIKNPIETMN